MPAARLRLPPGVLAVLGLCALASACSGGGAPHSAGGQSPSDSETPSSAVETKPTPRPEPSPAPVTQVPTHFTAVITGIASVDAVVKAVVQGGDVTEFFEYADYPCAPTGKLAKCAPEDAGSVVHGLYMQQVEGNVLPPDVAKRVVEARLRDPMGLYGVYPRTQTRAPSGGAARGVCRDLRSASKRSPELPDIQRQRERSRGQRLFRVVGSAARGAEQSCRSGLVTPASQVTRLQTRVFQYFQSLFPPAHRC